MIKMSTNKPSFEEYCRFTERVILYDTKRGGVYHRYTPEEWLKMLEQYFEQFPTERINFG
jgi:hypothetical protein